VQALRGERSALQTIVSELKQKVAERGPVCSPSGTLCVW
ncbi:MAG TPA: cell envelope biogenesis protein OmpA, partial [Candidatus Lambdaproteobacteria bacterium]|nr:cell envelope biogenesis protein OmpA [Candidatus Lambdaproteobacteria bacterium]